jgi:uncharacterized phage-like protein YoqJ
MDIVAFTGHRPEDCRSEEDVRRRFRDSLDTLKVSTIITGMAAGVDLWAADEARMLGIKIWCAKPWAGHSSRWGDEELYQRIIDAASRVVNVVDYQIYPGPWCYQKRNEWMVDHADRVLAYFSGKNGGTYNCLKYAIKMERPWENLY